MVKRNCSIRDVAEFVGVTPSTVSRVLNNRMGNLRVSEETRRQILAGAEKLNYTPNINAKRLFSRKSQVIALVLPSYQVLGTHVFDDHHLTAIFSGIEDALHGSDYNLLLIFNDEYFIREKKYLNLFKEGAVDGIMVWGATAADKFWQESASMGCPLLFIDTPPSSDGSFHFFAHDYSSGARTACDYLYERGHRKMLFLGGHADSFTNLAVERGLKASMEQYSDLEIQFLHGDYRKNRAKEELTRHDPRNHNFSAVLGININSAQGVIDVLRDRHLQVPEDISVLSCDSAENEDVTGITTLVVDDRALGFRATCRLLEMLTDPAVVAPREFLPIRLKTGLTTTNLKS